MWHVTHAVAPLSPLPRIYPSSIPPPPPSPTPPLTCRSSSVPPSAHRPIHPNKHSYHTSTALDYSHRMFSKPPQSIGISLHSSCSAHPIIIIYCSAHPIIHHFLFSSPSLPAMLIYPSTLFPSFLFRLSSK